MSIERATARRTASKSVKVDGRPYSVANNDPVQIARALVRRGKRPGEVAPLDREARLRALERKHGLR